MKRTFGALAILLASSAFASAADVGPTKVPSNSLFNGYPYAGSGFYFGINTIGGGGSVTASGPGVNSNSVVSTQVGVGGTFGYVWANANVFYAVEGMFDFNNFNGDAQGFSLAGPAMFEQRFKVGTPLANVFAFLPNNPVGGITTPPFPTLPNGQVASNVHPYMMASLHEDDVSLNFGLAKNTAWQFSPGFGLGMMGQLTNGLAIDVWTEAQLQQSAVCVGGGVVCTKESTKWLVGAAFYY